MGNSTIIELNHDWAGEIEREPLRFVREILDHLQQMPNVPDLGTRITGGTIISSFHRHDGDPFDHRWNDYRRALRQYHKFLDDKSAEMKAKGFKL